MKTITIRELHARTGKWVRKASEHGQIFVTDHGRTVARILPETVGESVPYFSQRGFLSPKIRRLIEQGKAGRNGTDSTVAISEDREDRGS